MKHELFSRYPEEVLDKFKKFHAKNPHVYAEFKKLAFKMHQSGRTKYSGRTIVEVLRWHHDLETTGSVFKISGDFVPILVRLLIYNHPEMTDFFDLKEVRSQGISSREEKRRMNQGLVLW